MDERKTYLSDKELKEFRQMLLDRRDLILGTYKDLVENVQSKKEQDRIGSQSDLPTHQADLALDLELDNENTQYMEHERNILIQIDEALRRIEDKTYGICLATGKPIDKERLLAKPWAKYSIDVARQMGERP